MDVRGVLDGPTFLGRIHLLFLFLFRVVLLVVIGDGAELHQAGTMERPHPGALAETTPSEVVVVVCPHLLPLGDALESPPVELAGEGSEFRLFKV